MKQADDRIASNLHRALNLNSKSCSSQNRKLHLVLDLDHTLLHSTELDHVTPQEEYLKTKTDDHSLEGDVFMDSTMITKLRPFVRTFLKEASHVFEMHIYTTGNRAYALRMAELLDPEQEYFFTSSSRVISCNDHSSRGQKKCLDLVRGCEDSNVLILDDTREAWTKENQDNLIVIRRYYFFKYSSQTMCLNNRKSLAELKTDENDYLEHILQLLKQVHAMFFVHKLPNKNHFGNDVRQVLKTLRKRVLKLERL
ncbi:RNA polymerase II C-terminal domain phosphatase-like 4 [Rosa rugosa]|uniref:RNA polymerase II C-terminal domain phosphatase-like 4 n=1 Tax=Rosa rugosa TaxID=74645 RepID=UPI002B4149B8|nr:RNA polymerase II C-terminal domain phosphatase-like 4 [Rosa rugosa]